MTPQEVSALTGALGDGPTRWIKSKMPPPAQQIVDNFKKEGQELSRAEPAGLVLDREDRLLEARLEDHH